MIALVDARPGWDDTGLTAVALAAVAGLAGVAARRRPWLWAILAGAPTPILEIATTGQLASLAAIGFAAIGAVIGTTIGRALATRPESR